MAENVGSVVTRAAGKAVSNAGQNLQAERQQQKMEALQIFNAMLQQQEANRAAEMHKLALNQANLRIQKLHQELINGAKTPEQLAQEEAQKQQILDDQKRQEIYRQRYEFAEQNYPGFDVKYGDPIPQDYINQGIANMSEGLPSNMTMNIPGIGTLQGYKPIMTDSNKQEIDKTTRGDEYWRKEFQKYSQKYDEDVRNWKIIDHEGKQPPQKQSIGSWLWERRDTVPMEVIRKYLTDEEIKSLLGNG